MDRGIQYLVEASIKLECTRSTSLRAMVLYHQFMRCVGEVKYDSAMVAAAALNLSSKVSEEVLDLDTLVLLFYCIVQNTTDVLDSDDATFKLLKKSLISVDFIMQRMLEFNLSHRLADQYLLPILETIYMRSLKIADHHEAVNETSLSMVHDFYTIKKCLNYKPDHIAVACIDAALHVLKLERDIEIVDPWYEGISSDLSTELVMEIKHDLFLLYKEEYETPLVAPTLPIQNKDTSEWSESDDCEVIELKDIIPSKKIVEEIVLD